VNELRRKLGSVPEWGWALLFSLVVCLPRLGAFGFWDPSELKLADQAREMVRAGAVFDPTVLGKYPLTAGRIDLVLAALGIKLFGASELGARLPIALSAVGALMAVYWAGAGLFRKRAALLGTLVLGSMTIFVLEARQLTTDVPLMAALALAMAGLGRYCWPASGRRRLLDLGVGALGLAVGFLAGGALAGVVLPVVALVAAIVVGWGLVPVDSGSDTITDGTADLAPAGVGPDVPAGKPFGASALKPGARAFPIFAVLAVGALVLLVASMTGIVANKYSLLLGGTPRSGAPTHTFETLVRELGFGMFPWSAVAVFALARPLIRLDGDGLGSPTTNARLAFGQLYLFLFAGLGFALSTYRLVIFGEARAVNLAPIALAIGVFLDEALEGRRSEPVAGLLMATGTMIVARDFYLTPEELASVHLFEKVKWPAVVSIGELVLGIALLAALGVYGGLATRGRALGRVAGPDLTNASSRRQRLDRLMVTLGRYGLQGAVGIAVVFALYLAQGLVPRLSTHFSFKPALESYAKFAKPGDKIARYHVEGHGTGFYGSEDITDVPSQDKLEEFLRAPSRAFALVSTDDLAAIDAGMKRAHQGYYVLDASSSRFLLISNQLGGNEADVNPLKKDVWLAPTPLGPEGSFAVGETPPWKWRIPLAATFNDEIELVGADFPETVRRPGKIPVDLIFRIKKAPPAGYKIFVHFDGPAAPRVIGDHDPLNKAFPTAYWLPGEYIRDHFETDVPLMTTPAGTYTVFIGFWPGGEGRRLKITQGTNDGADRVRLGTLEIK
jgi:hypothetical protein